MPTIRKRMACVLLAMGLPIFAQAPAAVDLLKQAEKANTGDTAAALKAYVEAVKIDPSVESLELISRYQVPAIFMRTDEEKQHLKTAQALTNEALRMYVGRHADDWEGVGALAKSDLQVDRAADAGKVLRGFLARHPEKAAAHRMLVDVYSKEHKMAEAFDEAQKLAQVPSCEPTDASLAGELAVQALLTQYKEPSPERDRMISLGEANLRRAVEKSPENFEATMWLSSLMYTRSSTEANAGRAAALKQEAEQLRDRAKSALQRQREISDAASFQRDWSVTIRQGIHSYSANLNRIMPLKRAPFTIEIFAPDDRAIGLNVFDGDTVQRRIHEGFRLPDDCKPVVAFCGGTAFAEEEQNPRKALVVASDGFHNLYHDSDTDHRWSRMKKTPVGFVLQRDVAIIEDTAVEKTSYCRLFLTFVRRAEDSGVLRADEVIRIVLQFE